MNTKIISKELQAVSKKLIAGACDFYDFGSGSSAREVFRHLQEEAREEHGSRGYTGTIAEKDGFKMVSNEPMSKAEAYKLAEKMIDDNDKYGPAYCIQIGNKKKKIKEVKPSKVVALDEKQAIQKWLNHYVEKYKAKGLSVAIEGSPRVEVLKINKGYKLEKLPSKDVSVKYALTINGSTDNTYNSLDSLKADLQKRIQENIKGWTRTMTSNKITSITTKTISAFDVVPQPEKASRYKVTGKISLSKPGQDREGYLFFGMASE